jgi:fibrillarin-like pre-rRNA processing protein
MKEKMLFWGIYSLDGKIATQNLVPGNKVYGEKLIDFNGKEYRLWDPYRSKLCAAILKGLKTVEIKKNSKVLYIGAATGTTASHVSDIVGEKGEVYCVEISERNFRELMKQCETRHNMLPMLQDARNVDIIGGETGIVDVIYQDVSTRDQAAILVSNAKLLKTNGFAYVAIKSQSISVAKKPSEVYAEFLKEISPAFEVIEKIDIAPFDLMHLFVVLKKK